MTVHRHKHLINIYTSYSRDRHILFIAKKYFRERKLYLLLNFDASKLSFVIYFIAKPANAGNAQWCIVSLGHF